MQTGGLRLDQAPPLAVPASFFLVAPAAVGAAGALLLARGAGALGTAWAPATIALTHLGTLGVLVAVMLGALYQVLPVVLGAPVPAARLAHGVWALLVAGVAGLVGGVLFGAPWAVRGAEAALGVGLAAFAIPAGIAVSRGTGPTAPGVRLAFASLGLAALAGLWMAHGWAGGAFPGPRLPWIQLHLCVGLLGWVGGLLTSVSWQLIPMFWLGEPPLPLATRAVRWGIAAGVAGALGAHAAGALGGAPGWAAGWLVPLAAAPAAVAVWGLHPALALRSLARRQRSRPDASLRWWQAGLVAGPLAGLCAAVAAAGGGPRWALAFGWLAIWGWAGSVIVGTLSRIVPFLVWFHRFSPLVGRMAVPSMRTLLPDRRVALALRVHLGGLGLGLAAIATGLDPLARATGGVLVIEGALLAIGLVGLLRRRPVA